MKRYMALGAVLAALGAGGAALGQRRRPAGPPPRPRTGGLSLMPAIDRARRRSRARWPRCTVANRSTTPLAVTVTPRPWVQSASGKVSPNRRATLPGVSVDKASFTLAPGAEQAVTATLNSAPSAGYLYGAIEAVGVPTDAAKRKGVVLGYRLVGALRILPAAPKTGLTAGNAKAVKGTAVLPVKNTGNTLDAVSGTVRVKSAGGHEAISRRGDQDPARQVDQRAARHQARQGLLHGHAVAQAARQDGADGDEEVQGQMSISSHVRFGARAATLDAVRLEP